MRLRSVDVQGVAHVSLPEFIDQCGGYCRVEPARVNADMLGRSVVLGVNDTKVYSSSDQFTLTHPVIRHRGEVLIALDDLDTLVVSGFAAKIRRPDASPEAPEDDPLPPDATPLESPLPTEPLTEAPESTDLPAPLPRETSQTPAGAAAAYQTIIIDPGHGGTDTGCVSAAGFSEKDLTLAVALALREILKETTSLKTYMTRSEDTTVLSQDRVGLANREQGDFFISIHAGAALSEAAEGLGVYYAPTAARVEAIARIRQRRPGISLENASAGDYNAQSRRAAHAMETAAAAAIGTSKHWAREAPVRILRDVAMPGVIVEVGYLTNPAEAALLESRSQQEKIARGMAAGIAAMMGPETTSGAAP